MDILGNDILVKKEGETEKEYLVRLAFNKEEYGLTWTDIASLMNEATGENLTERSYRRRLDKYNDEQVKNELLRRLEAKEEEKPATRSVSDTVEAMDALQKAKIRKMQATDERTQANAIYRDIARGAANLEMAKLLVDKIPTIVLDSSAHRVLSMNTSEDKEGIILASDWHAGATFKNPWNEYSWDIFEDRVQKMLDQSIQIIAKEGLKTVHVLNLGDLICGNIHLPLRINSREDVITQVIKVSGVLYSFLAGLSQYAHVEYYDCYDNHSRVTPNLKESLDVETFQRIVNEFLRLKLTNEDVHINENEWGEEIITLNVMGHPVAAVHGHHDKPSQLVNNITGMTKTSYDLCCVAHYHHFQADEKNECVVICNGSMMGTDDYAQKLRLNSVPSQNFIISTKENVLYTMYKMNLD